MGSAALLGQRTGDLHAALVSDRRDPDFAPEPFTSFYRRSLYQSLRASADRVITLLRDRLSTLPEETRAGAERLLPLKSRILEYYRLVIDRKITAMRIRCHGDYHLGQLLFTGKDFVVIDFEGEPARSLAERRGKRSALVDVAGMLRSLDYSAIVASRTGEFRPEDRPRLGAWSPFWSYWVSLAFLNNGYFTAAAPAGFLPTSKEELKLLLDVYILQKAVYELTYGFQQPARLGGREIRGIIEILQPTS